KTHMNRKMEPCSCASEIKLDEQRGSAFCEGNACNGGIAQHIVGIARAQKEAGVRGAEGKCRNPERREGVWRKRGAPRKRDVRAEGAGITGQGALEEGFAQGIVQPGKIGIAVNANDQNGALLVAEITA